MRTTITRTLSRYQSTFNAFAPGQKVVAIVGTLGLLLAGFLVFRWASTPDYSPLFTNMSGKDASAVIEKLDADGIPYEITGGGGTVMVPQDQVYATRIALSGEGLPTSSDGGYGLLDNQSISASQFQEQTAFKRAMEGELSKTIGAIDGVDAAVVHLAMPEKQVFADEQAPTTASVLVSTAAGTTLQPNQTQAIVHLVASSIDGLDPSKVTVADSTGQVLSADDGSGSGSAGSRTQQVEEYQDQMSSKIQAMLDRVVGPGNSTVTVAADLDFDKSVKESKTYTTEKNAKPLSESSQTETYTGPNGAGGVTGVVGPDGQMDTGLNGTGSGDGSYKKESKTADNAVNTVVERRESAPGTPTMKTVSVVLDSAAARNINNQDVAALVSAAAGIKADGSNGLVEVQSMPFDRTAEAAAAKELAAAAAAEKKAAMNQAIRNGALGGVVALMLALAWFKGRKRAKARAQATTYVVEQLRNESAARAAVPVEAPPAAVLALESTEQAKAEEMRAELAALVERQPEEVASLLRGWLVQN